MKTLNELSHINQPEIGADGFATQLFQEQHLSRREFIIKVAVVSACLYGCATSASSTWVCADGVCRGKGLTITKVDEQNTEVAIDAAAENSARNSKYFKHPLLTWSPALSVGVKQMDDQHIKLIYIANALDEAMENGTGDNVLGMIFSGLVSYTSTHFRAEERLMAAYDYPQLALHKRQHEDLVNQVLDLKRKYTSGKAHLSMDVMDFIKDWVRDHIQGHDKQYGLYLNARGIY